MQTLAFLQNLSSWEIVLIFLVVLLFFGAKRLPELFRSFGKSVKEFKKATTEIEEDIRTAMEDEPKQATQATPAGNTTAGNTAAATTSSAEPAPVENKATAVPAAPAETDDSKKA